MVTVTVKVNGENRSEVMMPFLEKMGQQFPFREVVPMTAKTHDHIARLFAIIRPYLPEVEPMYDADAMTDRS